MNKHKFWITILVGFIMSFLTLECFAQNEYYRHLVFRESPVSAHRGIYPLTENQKNDIAHYRFSYNENGDVLEISHRIGDDLISENDNWDSFTWWAPKIAIKYSKSEEIVTFFDHFNQPTNAFGKIAKAIYSLDKKGRRIGLKFQDLNGDFAENHWNVHRYEWTYPESGVVIEKRYNLKNEPAFLRPNLTFETVKLVYGDDDLLDFMYHIDQNGQLKNNTMGAAIDRIVYDHNDNFIRWMVFDADTNLVEGNAPQLALGEHLYNEYGNKVGLRGYDVKMNIKAFPSGFALESRKYDTFGNLISEKYTDIEGKRIVHRVYTYSESGKHRLTTSHIDDEGNLEDHYYWGWAKEVLEYDSVGRIVDRKFYKEDGSVYTNENSN